jgi:dihydrofolate synthase/folylpolyglutamate synthase
MRFTRIEDWLAWQETLHPRSIDLGLERVRTVLERLNWTRPLCPVVTVAGTKGKGSTVAILDSIYRAAGYRVGAFTSPHLCRYTERISIAGRQITPTELCAIFERIDVARGDISLTYFEFNTLAALLAFETAALDVMILEVGMGGRLDAVNVVDADVALVTSIGLDHTEWLGTDLNSIAREKAGIFRGHRPALFGSQEMPVAIAEVAREVGAHLLRAGQDFRFSQHADRWHWSMGHTNHNDLPLPGIEGSIQLENASSALAVVQLLTPRVPVSLQAIVAGLRSVQLSGRFQVIAPDALPIKSQAEWVLDVAHNALSAAVLASHLQTRKRLKTLIVFGVMGDKDVMGMVAALRSQVDGWLPVSLSGSRALAVSELAERLQSVQVPVCGSAQSVEQACQLALDLSNREGFERVLVCGSFMTVGPALDWLEF